MERLSREEIMAKFGYTRVDDFDENGIAVAEKGGDAFHIKADGTPLYDLESADFEIAKDFKEGLAVVGYEGIRYWHITMDGTPAYSQRFDYCESFSEGLAVVLLKGRRFHIKPDGTPAYPQRYEEAMDFENGLARVKDKDGWFHIKPDGTPAYQARFLGFSLWPDKEAQAEVACMVHINPLTGEATDTTLYCAGKTWILKEDNHQ